MNKIDFQWDLTETEFRKIMGNDATAEWFGRVRFGEYCVEFHMLYFGCNPNITDRVGDTYLYGVDLDGSGLTLGDGTPITRLCGDSFFDIPKSDTMDVFKTVFEQIITDRICSGDTEMVAENANAPTISQKAWEV